MEFKFVDEKENRVPEVGEWFIYRYNSTNVFVRIPDKQGEQIYPNSIGKNAIYSVSLSHQDLIVGGIEWRYWDESGNDVIIVEPNEPIYLRRKQ